ncbi:hypothetical protein B0H34DRAFT_673382 [Crassisporium funariophilum]|nr:hypothetical protein B0H34DRAFT_673382 [Crassisporium funariophilum]
MAYPRDLQGIHRHRLPIQQHKSTWKELQGWHQATSTIPKPLPVLDSEGYAICPECNARVKCGPSGLGNLEKRHRGSDACKDNRAKRDKNAKQKKNASILTFLKQKATAVKSTVSSSGPVYSHKLAPTPAGDGSPTISANPLHKEAAFPTPQPVSVPIKESFATKLQELVMSLPLSIPEALEFDRLAVFGGDPKSFDDPTISADELWETGLNNVLKATFGWGKERNMNEIIRRGKWGLDGLVNFVTYFVKERGVSESLFKGKLDYLFEELKKKSVKFEYHEITNSPKCERTTEDTVDTASSLKAATQSAAAADFGLLPVEVYIPSSNGPIPTGPIMVECDDEVEIVDVRMSKCKRTFGKAKISALECEGYTLKFPDGTSPHTAYPFALHDTLILPWDYAVKNGVMKLFATTCSGLSKGEGQACQPCRQLIQNKTLEGIFTRIEHGTHKNTAFAYLGISALQELLRRKIRAIEYYRLRGLNQARKLLSKATALSDQKRLLMAILSGKVSRVDRLLDIGLCQRKGACGLLASLMAAAEGHYTPKSFTEEEDMKSLLMWKMGANWLAEINHQANKGQSVTYLRTRSTVPPIIPLHEQPTVEQVRANVEATFDGLLDIIHSQNRSSLVHAVLMFDKLATEKRIRWDPKTNNFLGLCREHAHKTATEFVNEDDMEELFQKLDDGKVHFAGEATVGALGVLCKDNRIYPGRPVLVSGDCKKENGEEHAQVIQTVYDGVNSLQPKTRLRITSLASDGETRRGSAFMSLTFKSVLQPVSPIYPLLKPLKFLNLHVGNDDLTCDKDWKHVFERWRNLLLRQRGVVVMAFVLHLILLGISSNPKDSQQITFDPCFLEAREAIWILGKLLFNMVFPYLCVDLSLSEQIEHLSAAAHLALILFKLAGKEFIPTNLYIDLMIMIKNAIISTNLKNFLGYSGLWFGNDANLDILQLTSCLAGTTEVLNILAKYPQWDRSPRRLKLPAMSQDSKEIPDSADHIKPGSWRGNVKVKDVSLQTSWNQGRRIVEQECDEFTPIFHKLDELEGIDILSPFGTLLVNVPLSDDDVDESLEAPAVASANTNLDARETEMRVDVEDALAAELASTGSNMDMPAGKKVFNSKVLIKGTTKNKARALKEFGKYRNYTSSTDRLKRVQSIPRFVNTEKEYHSSPKDVQEPHAEDSQKIVMCDPITSLIRVENNFWLCLGEVNGLRVNGLPVDYISFNMLAEETVSVSYQMLGLRPATLVDDPEGSNDWRTYMMKEHSYTVPGRLVQSIDPTTSKTPLGMPFYLLQSTVLVALSASLFQGLAVSDLKNVPKLKPTQEYPYREASGSACFICESDRDLENIGSITTSDCPQCSPAVTLDLTQGQRVIEHIGSHILFDPSVIQSIGPLYTSKKNTEHYLSWITNTSGNFRAEMKKIWINRKKITVKRTKNNDSEIDTLAGSTNLHAGIGGVDDASDESGNEILGDDSEEELEDEPSGGFAEENAELDDGDMEDSLEGDDGNVKDLAPGVVSLGKDIGGKGTEEQGDINYPSGFVQDPEDFEVGPVKERSFYDNLQVSDMQGRQDLDNGRADAVQSTAEPLPKAAAVETQVVKELGQSKRKRVVRQLADALNGCLCGSVLDGSVDGVLKCNQAGCETQWYHLQCVKLEQEPHNWVCKACEASGRVRGGRRTGRQ